MVVNGRSKTAAIYVHQVVTGYKLVDHIDGDGLNNQEVNLRKATTSQNLMNKRKQLGASIFKGVTRNRNKWKSVIETKGQQSYLGVFDTEEEAALAYNKAARELFGQFAKLNEVRAPGTVVTII